MTAMSYADACMHPEIFGKWFSGPSWDAWRAIDAAIFGEPLAPLRLEAFRALSGRASPPAGPCKEAWIIAGRRSGKDTKAASIIVYLATIGAIKLDIKKLLVPGERGVIQLLAVDRKQARLCLSYARAMLEQPAFASMIERDGPEGIELNNGLVIEITTNDKRSVRGRTVIACVLDEIAFWRSADTGSVNPDKDVYDALKPAMATIPGAMLIGISSPHAKRGLLFDKFKKHYGQDDKGILVIKAPTWVMNPTLSRDSGVIAEAYVDDAAVASAEYGAEFRDDVAGFLPYDVIMDAVPEGVRELPPQPGIRYFAFADPSGGASDSFTLGIAHGNGEAACLDVLREAKAPFNPIEIVANFANLLKAYGLHSVHGDHYGAEWIVSAFDAHGISYIHSKRSRSEIYLALLPMMNSGKAKLLDNKTLIRQLSTLERRTASGGREIVDHAKGAKDDCANSAAGALVLAGIDGMADAHSGPNIVKMSYGPNGFRLISASPVAKVSQLQSTYVLSAEEEAEMDNLMGIGG